MNLREAAELAIEALQEARSVFNGEGDTIGGCGWCHAPSYGPCEPHCEKDRAAKALRAALAEPTSQESRQVEPVAYMSMCCSKGQTKPHSKTLFWPEQYTGRTEPVDAGAWGEERVVPLYTAPPKREPLSFAGVKITEVRLPENMAMRFDGDVLVIERAHGIGGDE